MHDRGLHVGAKNCVFYSFVVAGLVEELEGSCNALLCVRRYGLKFAGRCQPFGFIVAMICGGRSD